MNATPGLGSFNKDKVANKFGIQLKPKDGKKQSGTSSNERTVSDTSGTSLGTKNKTVSDFRLQNQSNGCQTNSKTSHYLATLQLRKTSLENSTKSQSSTELMSTSTFNERRNSFNSNVNHSTNLQPVKQSPSTESLSKSPSVSNIKDRSISPAPTSIRRTSQKTTSPEPSSIRRVSVTKTNEQIIPIDISTIKRTSISPEPSSIRRVSVTKTNEQTIPIEISTIKRTSISPEPSSIRRISLTKQSEQVNPISSSPKQTIIPNSTPKTEAEIEHQKDQPLYKRQLTKTLENSNSTQNKSKHPHDLTTTSSSSSSSSTTRSDVMQQHGHHTIHDVVLEDDIDPPFSPRAVTVKKNKLATDEYELMEILGRGKFGEVKKCREKSTQHLLAAKFIQINKEQDRIEALNEIDIMKSLQHPRLLQLYDAFETKGNFCLIMELISGGELFERVIDDDFILTERLCELYMMQICEGVSFMHSCNIIHLDMKPENILCVNRDGHRIKIIDFGLARRFDPTKQLKVLFGTPEFVAPEVINFDRVGFGTDMWSVGVICYVLLSGLSPFMGENDNDTYANINRANYDFDDEAFTDISDEAKDFISKLLVKDKDKRLPSRQCLSHPWLTRRPKLVSIPNDDETAEKKLSTKKLRRFVIRRRWQKAVNALLALQRMGMTL